MSEQAYSGAHLLKTKQAFGYIVEEHDSGIFLASEFTDRYHDQITAVAAVTANQEVKDNTYTAPTEMHQEVIPPVVDLQAARNEKRSLRERIGNVKRTAKRIGAVAVAAIVGTIGLNFMVSGSTGAKGDSSPKQATTEHIAGHPEVADKDKEQQADWSLHYYQFDPGVPQSYFGPNCAPQAFNPEACLDEMETRTRRDPMLLSVSLGEFGLIPGQTVNMLPEQKEAIRLSFAEQLKDEELRKEYHAKLSEKLEELDELKIEYLSGVYFSKYVTQEGNVVQIQKQMDPSVNYALVGTDKAGNKFMFKMDCGFQPVSKVPFKNVPVLVPFSPPFVPPPMPTKDLSRSPMFNPNIPQQVRGPLAPTVPAAPGENTDPNPATGCPADCADAPSFPVGKIPEPAPVVIPNPTPVDGGSNNSKTEIENPF